MASGILTIGTSSQLLAAADPQRGKILVQNLSANAVWLSFGRPAVAGQCLLLPPNMIAPLFLDPAIWWQDMSLDIFGVASAAGSVIYYLIQEIG